MFHFEKNKFKQNFSYVIGCDEVGRGSLAGPVVAVAAAINMETFLKLKTVPWANQVKDSKLISPVMRSRLSKELISTLPAYAVGAATPSRIDKINIHHATLEAMSKAVQKVINTVACEPEKVCVVVDGKFSIPELSFFQEALVKADQTIFIVSSASIIAKVYRDNLMVKLHDQFPEYNFAQHKGYGTKLHTDALRTYGLSSHHRQSFCKNYIA
jgi:ribonuclease HII